MLLAGSQEASGVAQLALLPHDDEQEHAWTESWLPVTEHEHDGVAQAGLSAVQLLLPPHVAYAPE